MRAVSMEQVSAFSPQPSGKAKSKPAVGSGRSYAILAERFRKYSGRLPRPEVGSQFGWTELFRGRGIYLCRKRTGSL